MLLGGCAFGRLCFWEAALSGGFTLNGSTYDGSNFRRVCFQEAVVLIAAFWEAVLSEAGLSGGCISAR